MEDYPAADVGWPIGSDYSPGVASTDQDADQPAPGLPPPRLLRWEIFAVLALSLGASALNALLNLIGSLLATKTLGQPAARWSAPAANPGSTWPYSSPAIAEALAPVLLVLYLLARSGERPPTSAWTPASPARTSRAARSWPP